MPSPRSKKIDQIRYYLFLQNHFNRFELERIFKQVGLGFDDIRGATLAGKRAELVLWLYRRRRIDEFVEICQQQKPKLDIFSEPVPDFEKMVVSVVPSVEQLADMLAEHFTLDELHLVAFFLGHDLDDFQGHLLGEKQTHLNESTKESLAYYGFDLEKTPLAEIKRQLKAYKMEQLVEYWQRHNKNYYEIVHVAAYLKPDVFTESYEST